MYRFLYIIDLPVGLSQIYRYKLPYRRLINMDIFTMVIWAYTNYALWQFDADTPGGLYQMVS